jgi:Ser/Thr protein kinase RdoA (MazF antagonist)
MIMLDAPIARGFTAEIFSWHTGQVLKLFNEGISRGAADFEATLTRTVHATGLPVPAVGEVIEVDGRYGLELERVDGISMLDALRQNPETYLGYAHQLAELQAEMHSRAVPELPDQGERLRRKITGTEKLPEEVRAAALKALEGMLEDDKLCHGDFHPGNILLSPHGPVIIDWIDASRGSPTLDVARSTLLFGGVHLPADFPGAESLNLILDKFYQAYIERYFKLRELDPEELERWLPVVAAARLDENIYYDEDRLLSIAQQLVKSE